MPYWTKERITWYQRAVEHTRFDRLLADALEPYLADCETVCDLACGTGYLAMELARRGKTYTGTETLALRNMPQGYASEADLLAAIPTT